MTREQAVSTAFLKARFRNLYLFHPAVYRYEYEPYRQAAAQGVAARLARPVVKP